MPPGLLFYIAYCRLAQLEDDVSDMEDSYNTASLGYISIQDHQLDLLRKCKSLRLCTQAQQKVKNSSYSRRVRRGVLPRAGTLWGPQRAPNLTNLLAPLCENRCFPDSKSQPIRKRAGDLEHKDLPTT
jgi:hypothetical protein